MGWSSNPKYRWYHADKKLHDFNGLFFERYYQFMALWWYLVFWYDNLWNLRTDKITKEKKTWVIKGKKTKAKGNNRKRPSLIQKKNENWKKKRISKNRTRKRGHGLFSDYNLTLASVFWHKDRMGARLRPRLRRGRLSLANWIWNCFIFIAVSYYYLCTVLTVKNEVLTYALFFKASFFCQIMDSGSDFTIRGAQL